MTTSGCRARPRRDSTDVDRASIRKLSVAGAEGARCARGQVRLVSSLMPARANTAPSAPWIHRRAREYARTITRVEKATAYIQWMMIDRMDVPATIRLGHLNRQPAHRIPKRRPGRSGQRGGLEVVRRGGGAKRLVREPEQVCPPAILMPVSAAAYDASSADNPTAANMAQQNESAATPRAIFHCKYPPRRHCLDVSGHLAGLNPGAGGLASKGASA